MAKKIGLSVLALLLIFSLTLALWYEIDGQPLAETEQYMRGRGYSVTRENLGSFVFMPDESNGYGLVIMHGALIKPQSYAKTAAFFAAQGYTVLLPNGRGRLSITEVDSTAERLDDFELDGWFFIGHSMGGLSTLELVSKYEGNVKAVALWSSAMPFDHSDLTVPMLFIWGDNDGLLPAERFAEGRKNLPEDLEIITLKGGNHRNFAMYSHQFFDNELILDPATQVDSANTLTVVFFGEHL